MVQLPPLSTPSADVAMADVPPKTYADPSLTDEESAQLSQLSERLQKQPPDLPSHMEFVKLLHDGFARHVAAGGKPGDFSLLSDLRGAREAASRAVPIGEVLWLDWLHDERLLAQNRVAQTQLLDLLQRAITEEPASIALWRCYGDHIYYLWSMAFDVDSHPDEFWTTAEKDAAKAKFTRAQLMLVWEQAVAATQHNIQDGNVIWDRYMEVVLSDPAAAPSEQRANEIRSKFENRLLKYPHRTWEGTFSAFSKLVSAAVSNRDYEKIMQDIHQKSTQVRENYEHRAAHEQRISQARNNGDEEAERQAYTDYLAWEVGNSGVFSFPYINSLYERAVTRFWNNSTLWTAYVEYLISNASDMTSLLSTLERATRHCPWSGDLWSHRLWTMEKVGKTYQEVETLKHQATATGLLELGGWEELIKFHTTYCGYLSRKAFEQGATEEQLDIAHIGIVSAIEYINSFGKKSVGEEWRGDPQYRLERTQIEFLTQRGEIDQARDIWKQLVKSQHDRRDFWNRYYMWEMVAWAKYATAEKKLTHTKLQASAEAILALQEALKYHATMDNPETILALYQTHCEQHESFEVVQSSVIQCRELHTIISGRRYKEYEAAAQQHYDRTTEPNVHDNGEQDANQSLKRKRSLTNSEVDPHQNKKAKDQQTRDREHTTLIVRNFPSETTYNQIRRLFTDKAGEVKKIKKFGANNDNSVVIVEMETQAGAELARGQIRTFGDSKLDIRDYSRASLWCTNYPAAADEAYIRDLFQPFGEILEVRFPSTTTNARRRFCYIDFANPDDAVRAESTLNGKVMEGGDKLKALISDPLRQEERESAIDEQREVYIHGLEFHASRDDVREFFEQCGTVVSVRLPRQERNPKLNAGFGHVQFETKACATLVVVDTFANCGIGSGTESNCRTRRQEIPVPPCTSQGGRAQADFESQNVPCRQNKYVSPYTFTERR